MEKTLEKYLVSIKDGRDIYIPSWPVQVQLENLTTVCKLLGDGNVINIAALNFNSAKFAILNADDPKEVANVVQHFVCQVRIDGKKIEAKTFDTMFEGQLKVVVELFTHVVHSQYSDFFDLGEVKENSQ